MGLSQQLLGDGETEVFHLHSHFKALFLPILLLLVLAFGCGFAIPALPDSWQPWGTWVLVAVALVLFLIGVFLPWLRWVTTTYTFTDRRIITRRGIITRVGHDLPLTRINNISYTRSLLDRVLGCGTLELTTAADEPVVLHDIPRVERIHVAMT
jgi:uncharacterized membrane protein YdbT with pleckstrin-like domain